jgi:hypothetical protein
VSAVASNNDLIGVPNQEEIAKAEVEAWHKTHYRQDWLLSRTLGYAILSSTLAIYIFWAESGQWPYTTGLILGLSLTWMFLLAMGMLWYDFHTRVSYEHWPEVRSRLSRHVVVSVLSFAGALVLAYTIHGASLLMDRAITAPPDYVNSIGSKTSGSLARKIHWHKGLPPDMGKAAVTKIAPDKKPAAAPAKTAAATKPAAVSGKHAELYVPPATKPKTGATKTTAVVTKKATPPVKAKPKVKPQPKPDSLPKHAYGGQRVRFHGKPYHYYGGRWHLVRG